MNDPELDGTDRRIVHALQENGVRATNASISEKVGRSPSTIGKRIKRLESEGVLRESPPDVDYERAGYPLHILFSCTALLEERGDFSKAALDVPGVVEVQELMRGDDNVLVEAVARDTESLTRIAHGLRSIGLQVGDETLVRSKRSSPSGILLPPERSG